MLEVEGIHTYYGPSHVLQGVSLTVREGEVVCLLGRNGAGKTTTLRSIIGLTPPRRGSIRLLGREMTGWHPYQVARMGIGYVDQGRRIFPALSVDENLEVAENGRKGAWTKVEVYRAFPELVPLRSRLGRHLSGGEQQILAIGRALMGNPVLLLCDEPSEGLAPLLVRRLGALLREVAGQGLAVLLAEQNLRFALDLAHRGYIIDKARVRLEGPTDLLRGEEIVRRHLAL